MGLPEPARAPAGAPEAGRRHWGSCQHTPKDELGPRAVTQRMSPGGQGQGARCPAAGPPGRAHAFQEPGCLPVPAPETQTRSRAGPTVLPAGPRSGHPAGRSRGLSSQRRGVSNCAPGGRRLGELRCPCQVALWPSHPTRPWGCPASALGGREAQPDPLVAAAHAARRSVCSGLCWGGPRAPDPFRAAARMASSLLFAPLWPGVGAPRLRRALRRCCGHREGRAWASRGKRARR